MKIMRVVGARPQFMQEVVFRKALDARGHTEILVHTGQHYDDRMSRVFFEELGIPLPDVNLNVGSGGHGQQTGRMLETLELVVQNEQPDAIVVDGDTNSTLAGALTAAKMHVPLVHVEAGLRSFDRRMPEEVNRVVTDHLANLLCAPTKTAINNLEKEGIADNVVLTGDLMYDCFLHFRGMADYSVLQDYDIHSDKFLLATVHRAENTEDQVRFQAIVTALSELPLPVILPAHPRIQKELIEFVATLANGHNLLVIDPVGYLQMLALEQKSSCILTDSGGVQREAFFAGKPSVVLRNTTEWVEQVDSGWSILADADEALILESYHQIMQHTEICEPPPPVYGSGDAAVKVIKAMEGLLG